MKNIKKCFRQKFDLKKDIRQRYYFVYRWRHFRDIHSSRFLNGNPPFFNAYACNLSRELSNMLFFDPSGQFNSNYSQCFDLRFGFFSSAETLHRFMGRNTQQYHDVASRPHQSKRYYARHK